MSVLGVVCKLEGFGSKTKCNVNPNDIEVFFNGDEFNESAVYKIYLNGMNNPNYKMDSKYFYAYSQFSETDPKKTICSTKAPAPEL